MYAHQGQTIAIRIEEPNKVALGLPLAEHVESRLGDNVVWACKDGDLSVNRAIASASSGMFSAKLDRVQLSDFAVKTADKVKDIFYTRTLRIEDMGDPEVIRLLHHLSFDDLPLIWPVVHRVLSVANCARMLAMAAEYNGDTDPIVAFVQENMRALTVHDPAALAAALSE